MMSNAAQMVKNDKVPTSTGDCRISASTLSQEYLSQTHSLHWSSMNQSKLAGEQCQKAPIIHLQRSSSGVLRLVFYRGLTT